MARKKQMSLFDQAKSWKDSDTAKAVGTILAVLLIPASVIAWNYLSKSEFIRNLIMEKLDRNKKEKIGWMILAEKSMNKIWDNKEDEVWSKYI